MVLPLPVDRKVLDENFPTNCIEHFWVSTGEHEKFAGFTVRPFMIRVCEKASFAKQARRGAMSRFCVLFLFSSGLLLLDFSSEYINDY